MDVAYALGAGTGGALASVFVKLAVTAPAMLCAAVPASCEGTEDAEAGWFSQVRPTPPCWPRSPRSSPAPAVDRLQIL